MNSIYSLLKELYDTQRKLDERNFAKSHSFEEWVENRNRIALSPSATDFDCVAQQTVY